MSEINTVDALGDDVAVGKLIDRSITEFVDNVMSTVGQYAFYKCNALTMVSFPAATSVGSRAFQYCQYLTSASLPSATTLADNVFNECTRLKNVDVASATSLKTNAFSTCSELVRISLPAVASIGEMVFRSCRALTTVILGNTSQVATLSNTNAFYMASNAIIYVPDALVDSYKSATNWSTYADRIKPISELPEE